MKVKPLVKWVGGKRQLLKQFINLYPNKYNKYFEPFVGGGAVFFELSNKNAYISDINSELINLYNVVKENPLVLIAKLKTFTYNKDFFLDIRSWDRELDFMKKYSKVDRAARLMFLNRTCFNGLYRVNSKGFFNTPFGTYINPDFIQEENVFNVSNFLNVNNIEIGNHGYIDILTKVKKGDFVYLDPPYDELEGSKNFTAYNNSSFGRKQQEELRDFCNKLDKKGVYFMLSNHDTSFIKNIYNNFDIQIVKAKRNINSNGKGRGLINEIVIRNYK